MQSPYIGLKKGKLEEEADFDFSKSKNKRSDDNFDKETSDIQLKGNIFNNRFK
jgi:hypothetical protein